MDRTFHLTVNGKPREIRTDPGRSLLEVLREDLQLTGTKLGCGEGQCRACTVLVDGRSVTSCRTKMTDVEGRSVVTIEGLADAEKLHPIQEIFVEESAFQCGFCTPGMVLGMVGFVNEKPDCTADEIQARMQRHLCRCCGYPRLRQVIRRVAAVKATFPKSGSL